MDDDIFDDSQPNEELLFASREYERFLDHIENVISAFHEALEESKQESVQKAFDDGYEFAFKHLEKLSFCQGIVVVLLEKITNEDDKLETIQIQTQLHDLIVQVEQEFEDESNLILKNASDDKCNYQSALKEITPSQKCKETFNHIQMKLIDVCNKLKLDEKFINEIKRLTL